MNRKYSIRHDSGQSRWLIVADDRELGWVETQEEAAACVDRLIQNSSGARVPATPLPIRAIDTNKAQVTQPHASQPAAACVRAPEISYGPWAHRANDVCGARIVMRLDEAGVSIALERDSRSPEPLLWSDAYATKEQAQRAGSALIAAWKEATQSDTGSVRVEH